MSETLDINLNQGSFYSRIITVKDSDNVAVDLADRTYHGYAVDNIKLPKFKIPFILNPANQTTNTGQISWEITSESTAELKVFENQEFHYFIWETYDSRTYLLFSGKLTFKPTAQ